MAISPKVPFYFFRNIDYISFGWYASLCWSASVSHLKEFKNHEKSVVSAFEELLTWLLVSSTKLSMCTWAKIAKSYFFQYRHSWVIIGLSRCGRIPLILRCFHCARNICLQVTSFFYYCFFVNFTSCTPILLNSSPSISTPHSYSVPPKEN